MVCGTGRTSLRSARTARRQCGGSRARKCGRHSFMSADTRKHRFGMVIDLDKCTGCGACMVACAVENNVPPARPEATERTGITWMRVHRMDNGGAFPASESV